MNKKTENKAVSPWQWVPSLYFAQGIPYVVVMSVAVILFKRMGMSNTDIALYTSGLVFSRSTKGLHNGFITQGRFKPLV